MRAGRPLSPSAMTIPHPPTECLPTRTAGPRSTATSPTGCSSPTPRSTRRSRRAPPPGLPAHGVSPTQGRLLELLVRVQGARAILELGTLGGYSTIWLGARARVRRADRHPRSQPALRRGRPREHRTGRARRGGRAARRSRGDDPGAARGRRRRPVRPDLHRRRQGRQRAVPDLGARALTPGHADRRRQRRARRHGGRPRRSEDPSVVGVRRFFDLLAAGRASARRPSRRWARRATTASRSPWCSRSFRWRAPGSRRATRPARRRRPRAGAWPSRWWRGSRRSRSRRTSPAPRSAR